MVEEQLVPRDISDEKTLRAMRTVPRHLFVDDAMASCAYGDHPLPIGAGQTISQPYIVALMTDLLDVNADSVVLEVGTGSGYQTAILAELAEQVFSIERVGSLASRARQVLEELGADNVAIRVGDGSIGWTEFEPYDRIIVTAGAPEVPQSLVEQLGDPGIMAVPVGSQGLQQLRIIERSDGEVRTRDSGGCVFVPLVGREGWSEQT